MTKPTKPTNKLQKRTKVKMAAFLKAHKLNGSNISLSCKSANINRDSYYEWIKKYSGFMSEVDACQEQLFDFVEGALHKGIKEGNTAMTIFFAKTKMKDRGYVEKQEITHSGNIMSSPINIVIEETTKEDGPTTDETND